jgi:succinoglycan biosynthesis protein ExoA
MNSNAPKITMLLAVFNEARHIEQTLKSLVCQSLPSEQIEVLIIDGGSTDQTRSIAHSFVDRLPLLRVVSNPKRLSAAGWNLGLANATAPFVCILSGHVLVPSNFAQAMLGQLNKQVIGVGGRAIPIGDDGRSKIIATAYKSRLGNGGASFMEVGVPRAVESVAFGCYWRDKLIAAGGFDESIVRGQDWDLNLRLTRSGYTLWCDPAIELRYSTRSDFRSLWRRQFLAGYWKPYIHRKNTAPFLWRHWVPAVFVAGFVGLAMGSLLSQRALFAFLFTMALHIGISIWVSRRTELIFFDRIQFWWAIWIIQFAYGLGFLGGLVKCLRVRKKPTHPQLNF